MMIGRTPAQLAEAILVRAKDFGADLAGIASAAAVKQSPSHRLSSQLPDYRGVGAVSAGEGRRIIDCRPAVGLSAVVLAIAHPPGKPELDWWTMSASGGNTPGNQLLMAVVDRLADWLDQSLGIRSHKLPYHVERGAVYMKDAAALAGLGCIGKNNLLITPQYGPHQRLRVMLVDADLPPTGPIKYDPCADCPMPCRQACPRQALSTTIYRKTDYGIDHLPARSGAYDRLACNRQMEADQANAETLMLNGQEKTDRRVRYCRACELACPVGAY
jgi:epoxyqueuosine reductase